VTKGSEKLDLTTTTLYEHSGVVSGNTYCYRISSIASGFESDLSSEECVDIPVAENTLSEGLVAYYPFNGNANDESGNGFDDGMVNGAILTTDRFGTTNSAYSFDGNDDYLEIQDSASIRLMEHLSISSWVYLPSLTEHGMTIVEKGSSNEGWEYSLMLTSTNEVKLIIHTLAGNGAYITLTSLGQLATERWHHITAVYSENVESAIYINGVLDNTSSNFDPNYSPSQGNASLTIGSRIGWIYNDNTYPYQGSIDDVRIYNRAISEAEVANLFGSFETPPSSEVDTVVSAGQVWMDRNLGASRVAESFDDAEAYGDLYQWGRGADGHEKRDSETTTVLSSTDDPGHGDFIITTNSPYDWRSPQNDNLWQGVAGVNNVCPAGFRLPTNTELEMEGALWFGNSAHGDGTFLSPLKLVQAGMRPDNGLINFYSLGFYWSSTISGVSAHLHIFQGGINNGFFLSTVGRRVHGASVRCLKD